MARLITNPAASWLYSSEPEASTNGRRLPVPRGKLLGGSSSINGMVFVRGQAQDFDIWAQMGNRGWSYTEVLPYQILVMFLIAGGTGLGAVTAVLGGRRASLSRSRVPSICSCQVDGARRRAQPRSRSELA
jgi:choline dehydrogenase-like flavoprotein